MRIRTFAVAALALLAVRCDDGRDRAAEIRRLEDAFRRDVLETPSPRPAAVPVPEEPGLERALARMERGVASRSGHGFESFRSDDFRAGLEELKGLVAADALTPAEEERVEAALRAHLALDPPPREAWWDVWLAAQDRLDERLGAEPGDDDALEAWKTLRDHLSSEPPDLAGLKQAARTSGNEDLAMAAASILLAAERLPDLHEGLKRDLEAVLLAIAVNRYRRAHDGAWPEDLEAIRPEEVQAHPGGGTWALGPDPETDVPSIFLHGGRRFGRAETGVDGFHSGPERPLFRFPE